MQVILPEDRILNDRSCRLYGMKHNAGQAAYSCEWEDLEIEEEDDELWIDDDEEY